MYVPAFETTNILNENRIAGKITTFPFTAPVTNQLVDYVNLYVMHGLKSYWTSLPDWPAYNATSFYLISNGSLDSKPNPTEGQITYFSDPHDPVPTHGGNNLLIVCGPLDQAEVDKRADVITFETPALETDTAVCGHILAELFVSSNCTDTDFMVKVEDVSDWDAELVIDAAMAMKWRNGMDAPYELVEPNKVYPITIDIWHACRVFEAGHKIRVAVQSSNYPRFLVNNNNGLL